MQFDTLPMPGPKRLFANDVKFRRAANVLGFGLMVAAGMYWVSRPMPQPQPPIDNSFDMALAKAASIGGIVLAGVGLVMLLVRWRRVRTILSEGRAIQGVVANLDYVETTRRDEDSISRTRHTRRSHYVTLSYEAIGQPWEIRQKLPNAGFVFGLAKGRPVELIVHDLMPDEPLVRSLYVARG